MRNFLVIENGVILEIVSKEGAFELSDYEGSYDTVAEDASGKFLKGDDYSVEKLEEYNLSDEEKEARVEALRKAEIARQLSVLVVTTANGNTFDATSQARQDMADAIIASRTLGLDSTTWRLANNSEIVITLGELKEAHALAIQAYAMIKGIGA